MSSTRDSSGTSADRPVAGPADGTGTLPADTRDDTPPRREDATLLHAVRSSTGGDEGGHPAELDVVDAARYARERAIGRGGLGKVTRALDRRLGRDVAIKELLEPTSARTAHFVREALITARLQHPSIVPLYDAGFWDGGEAFYSMKLIDGTSLAQRIRACASIEERLALLPAVIAVADAIAYAHQAGIVHRDLKPSNVVLGPYGEVVVVDWGVARDLAEPAEIDTRIVGTPAYMPPEQAAGALVDERADVYAIGAILYTLLSGQTPYAGSAGSGTLERVRREAPAAIAEVAPGAPRDLVAIAERAMARDPAARYATAQQLADELRRFQAGQLISARRYSRWERLRRFVKRHRGMLALSSGFLVALGAVGVISVARIDAERDRALAARNAADQQSRALLLASAQGALERDPTETIAWLRTYPEAGERWRWARTLAGDALDRGVATHVLRGHDSDVVAVAFSADGRLATASYDHTVGIWTLDGAAPTLLHGHRNVVLGVSFSPDGRELLSWDADGIVRLWALGDGTARIVGEHGAGYSIATFAADGAAVLSAGNHEIQRWWRDGGEIERFAGHAEVTRDVEPLADGGWVSTGRDGEIRRWWRDGRYEIVGKHDAYGNQLAVSPDETLVASAAEDGTVGVWPLTDAVSLAESDRLRAGHDGPVEWVAFSADGQRLISASRDDTLRLWSVQHCDGGRVLSAHDDDVVMVVRAPDGGFASASADGSAAIWDSHGRLLGRLQGHDGPVEAAAFSADGARVATVSRDGSVRVWPRPRDTTTAPVRGAAGGALAVARETGTVVVTAPGEHSVRRWSGDAADGAELPGAPQWPTAIAVSSDGDLVAVASGLGQLVVWRGGAVMAALDGSHGVGYAAAVAPTGAAVAAGFQDGAVLIVSLATGEARTLTGHEQPVPAVAFSPDGRHLASTSYDGTVRVWRVADGAPLGVGRHELRNHTVAWHPDGTHLASGGLDKDIRVWSRQGDSLRQVHTLAGHGGSVVAVRYLEDGRLVSASKDKTVRTWRGGELAQTLRSTAGALYAMDVAPSKERVVTAGEDGVVRLWDLRGGGARVLGRHDAAATHVRFVRDDEVVSIDAGGDVRVWRDELPAEIEALRAVMREATTAVIGPGTLLRTPLR